MPQYAGGPTRSRRRLAVIVCTWCLLLAAVGGLAAHLVQRHLVETARGLTRSDRGLALEDLIVALAALVLVAALAWLSLAVTVCLAAEAAGSTWLRGHAIAARVSPRAVRLLVRALCGVVALAPLHPVQAHPVDLPPPDRPDVLARPVATGPAATQAVATQSPSRPTAPPRVVVRHGDTLWSIAAAHLPPEASAADIGAAWPRWFAANRARIGPDPHLIYPGTRLVLPSDLASRAVTTEPPPRDEEPR